MKSLVPGLKSGIPSSGALDSEQLRIDAALAHIREHGNLDDHPGDRNELRAIMVTAVRRGLVAWDRRRERYQLTSAGKSQIAGLEAAAARVAASAPAAPVQAGLAAQDDLTLAPVQAHRADGRPVAAALPPAAHNDGRRAGDGRRAVVIATVVALAVGTGIGGLMASSRLLPGLQKSTDVADANPHTEPTTTVAGPAPVSGAATVSSTASPPNAGSTRPAPQTGAAPATTDLDETKAAEAADSKPDHQQATPSTKVAVQVDGTAPTPGASPARSIFGRHHHHYSRHERRAPEEVAHDRMASSDGGEQAATAPTGDQALAAAPSTEPAETTHGGTSTRYHRHHSWRHHRDDNRQYTATQQDGFWGPQPGGALSYSGRDGMESRSSRSRYDGYGTRRSGPDREAMESHSRGGHFGTDPVFGWLFR